MLNKLAVAVLLGLACGLRPGAALAQDQDATDSAAAEASPSPNPEPAAPRSEGPRPEALALTVSGGVSLGSHEAGLLYALVEGLKRDPRLPRLRVAAGASAGSVNALIALINSCRKSQLEPTADPGYRTWIPVGLKDLFREHEVRPRAVFTREPLRRAMNALATDVASGVASDCDVLFGASVTRLLPIHTHLSQSVDGGLLVPRQVEHFAIRMRGNGPGHMPRFESFADPDAALPSPLLPFRPGAEEAQAQNFDHLADLIFASATFPLAFEPYPLAHCMGPEPGSPVFAETLSPSCEEVTAADFVDGGVFDNTPLRLAMRLASRGLRSDGDLGVRTRQAEDPSDQPPRARIVYVNPDESAHPPLDDEEQPELSQGVFDLAANVLRTFADTARSRELYAVLEESEPGPDSPLERVSVTRSDFPGVSNKLAAFFGFFERDFRVFDYYLGMYEGLATVQQLAERVAEEAGGPVATAETESLFLTEAPSALSPGQRPFACMVGYFDPAWSRHRAACEGPSLRNFRILLQTTFDRLRAACERLPADAEARYVRDCQTRIAALPMQVEGVAQVAAEARKRGPKERDFDYLLRLLSLYRFEYRDLGLDPDQASYGAIKVRRSLLKIVSVLADRQPTSLQEVGVKTLGRAAVNEIAYEPPRDWIYASIGTALEAGASVLPFDWNESWARLNLALQIKNWQSIVRPGRRTVAFTPLVGPEFELLFMSTPFLQSLIGARVGFQFGVVDRFLLRTCSEAHARGDARRCSQLVLQSYFAATVMERLRAQLTVELYPTDMPQAPLDGRVDLQLGFGVQFF